MRDRVIIAIESNVRSWHETTRTPMVQASYGADGGHVYCRVVNLFDNSAVYYVTTPRPSDDLDEYPEGFDASAYAWREVARSAWRRIEEGAGTGGERGL